MVTLNLCKIFINLATVSQGAEYIKDLVETVKMKSWDKTFQPSDKKGFQIVVDFIETYTLVFKNLNDMIYFMGRLL